MDLVNFLVLILSICVVNIECLMFNLGRNQRKCLKEEIHKDVLVTGEYEISDAPGQQANLRVWSLIFVRRRFDLCSIDNFSSIFQLIFYVKLDNFPRNQARTDLSITVDSERNCMFGQNQIVILSL